MPQFSFVCPNGHSFDELFIRSDELPAPPSLKCACGQLAIRKSTYSVAVVGPVFEHVEAYEKALLTDRQRARGERIRTKSDIDRIEREQGIHREDETFYHVAKEEMRHEAWQIENVKRTSGTEAAITYVEDLNLQERTGWTQQQVNEWKDNINAAERSGITPSAEVISNGTESSAAG